MPRTPGCGLRIVACANFGAYSPENCYPLFGAGSEPKAVYRSVDGGKHWQMAGSSGGPGMPSPHSGYRMPISGYLTSFAATSSRHAVLALNRDWLYVTNNGGKSWQTAAGFPGAAGDVSWGPLDFIDSRHGWISMDGGSVFRRADGGLRWNRLPLEWFSRRVTLTQEPLTDGR